MSSRNDPRPTTIMVGVALLFAGAIYSGLLSALPPLDVGALALPTESPTPSPSPTPAPPEVEITHDTCCEQTARFLNVSWTSTEEVTAATVTVEPAPTFECSATAAPDGLTGTFGCSGLLPGATDHVARLVVTTAAGEFPIEHTFKTMGDRLENVQWFTEFEDPKGQPLACAAASCRIIQLYTTGEDKMTAEEILNMAQAYNRSQDPGLDPVAIATILKRMDGRNNYHYYRYATKEEATAAAVYWLFRSGKPVVAITLAGQHAPLVIGFEGTYGTSFEDPANKITGVVVQDPQRGDMDPATAFRRADKYRSPSFQTGHLLPLSEWYGDEWWFAFKYATVVRDRGQLVNVERNDGAYPIPHWAGKYVLIVDDADEEWDSSKEGRVEIR